MRQSSKYKDKRDFLIEMRAKSMSFQLGIKVRTEFAVCLSWSQFIASVLLEPIR